MFLKGVWFLIAGVLLLGQAPALAGPYVRVLKDGVVHYYFASREPAQPGPAGKHPLKLRGEAWIEVPPPPQQPRSPAPGPVPIGSTVEPAAVSPTGSAGDLPVANPAAPKGLASAGTDYLLGLLTQLGRRYPLALPAAAGLPPVARHTEVSAVQSSPPVVPEGWQKLLRSSREQPAALGQVLPGPAFFTESGPRRYCFPLAGPFSFRDTWGEPRPGGRLHRAVDIFAPEGSPVYAITTGVIAGLGTFPEAGNTLFLRGQDGRGYGYMHLLGYAPGLAEGQVVHAGELVGYVGHTGTRASAAHLHLQVYAGQRLCKDELVNPYGFLVQLCHGVGVNDLYQPRLARLENPQVRASGIKVYRRPKSAALRRDVGQFSVRDSSITVIKNF